MNFLKALEDRLREGFWFRRGLGIAVFVLVWRMTDWGMRYAQQTLDKNANLLDTAAIITAVAGIPVILLTLLVNKYVETRNNDTTN